MNSANALFFRSIVLKKGLHGHVALSPREMDDSTPGMNAGPRGLRSSPLDGARPKAEGISTMFKILGRLSSVNVQKVVWAAGEVELAFERIDIGGAFGGNREAPYLAKNIPTVRSLWSRTAMFVSGSQTPSSATLQRDMGKMSFGRATPCYAVSPTVGWIGRWVNCNCDEAGFLGFVERAGYRRSLSNRRVCKSYREANGYVGGTSIERSPIFQRRAIRDR